MTVLDTLLERAVLRAEGRFALTVLVGDPADTLAAWTTWAERSGLLAKTLELGTQEDPSLGLLRAIDARESFARAAVGQVAEALEMTPSELRCAHQGATVFDVQQLFTRVSPGLALPSGLDDFAFRAVLAEIQGLSPPRLLDCAPRPPWPFAKTVTRWIPLRLRPAVLFFAPAGTNDNLRRMIRFAQEVPEFPLAVACTAGVFEDAVSALSDLESGILRSSRLDVPPAPAGEPVFFRYMNALQARLALAGPHAPTLEEVLEAGGLHRWKTGSPRFRSSAELLLYAYLERWPQTRGLFVPNVRPGLLPGGRPIELDLHSEQLGLVIELDGADIHLPLEPDRFRERYRSDRAKDWLLQTRGLRILRILSDDVGPYMEEVRARILRAVADCRRHEPPKGQA